MDKSNNKPVNINDDGNTPKVNLPSNKNNEIVEPLPETFRPRKDGPGGESGE